MTREEEALKNLMTALEQYNAFIPKRPRVRIVVDGKIRTGIVSSWREGSAWVKVQITDGLDDLRQLMVHESEPLEIIRDEPEAQR